MPQFRDAADQVPIDWPRLKAYLAANGMVLALDPAPRQFAGGMGNLNFRVTVDDRPMVLRRPPLGPIPPGANDMKREHRVLNRLWKAYPLAPRSWHYCADADVIGAHFLVMDYRDGQVISGATLPESLVGDETATGKLTAMLIETLATLHEVDPASVDLDDFGRPDGFLSRAIEGWAKRAAIATDDRPSGALIEVRDWLRARPVPPSAPALLHNDFKLDNMLLDPSDPLTPVAVVDWDQSTRGDPLFDLATLISYWTEAGDPQGMHDLAQMPTAAPGALTRNEAVALYAELTGRDVSEFSFHRVLAMYKLGIVFLQLHAQFVRGTVTDPRYAGLGQIGNDIMDFARDVALGRAS